MNKKQLEELQDLPEELRYKIAKYMYVHEPKYFDKRVNNKPKEKKKFIPLVKFESTLDQYLFDKQRDTTAVKEQPKTERGYGLMSLFRSKI
jgi:abortive infection bacteriophage resistance protein